MFDLVFILFEFFPVLLVVGVVLVVIAVARARGKTRRINDVEAELSKLRNKIEEIERAVSVGAAERKALRETLAPEPGSEQAAAAEKAGEKVSIPPPSPAVAAKLSEAVVVPPLKGEPLAAEEAPEQAPPTPAPVDSPAEPALSAVAVEGAKVAAEAAEVQAEVAEFATEAADVEAEIAAFAAEAAEVKSELAKIEAEVAEVATEVGGAPRAAAAERKGRLGVAESLEEAMPRRGMSLAEWETLIGGNWLNKLGIIVFVVGVALLLGYSLRYFGPLGKILTGTATGLALLVIGIALEGRERYAMFAKPIIGGGWAILYFTAYATYNVEASKIVDEPMVALLIMAAVAAGMILHSFKYRSQIVTALAYGLGYVAIVISPLTGFSLIAIALLAASLIAVLRVMPWFHLALVAEAGTYVSHFLWMAQSGGEPTAAELWFNQGVLALYWVLFTILLFLKRKEEAGGKRTLLAVSVGNATGFLALGGWAIWESAPSQIYLLAAGSTVSYAAVSYLLLLSGQRLLFLFNSTMAVVLGAATWPLAMRSSPTWDREWLAVYWAAGAGIVATIGFRVREILLRLESYVLCLASALALVWLNLGSPTEGRHLIVWASVIPVVLFFYSMWEKLRKAAGKEGVLSEGRDLGIALGYVATVIIAILLWREAPEDVVGLIWLGLGIAYFELGAKLKRPHWRGQGYLLAAFAILAFAIFNLLPVRDAGAAELLGWSNWICVSPGILALYYMYWRLLGLSTDETLVGQERLFRDTLSWAGSALLAVLLWRELPADAVGPAWLVEALGLFLVGARWQHIALRGQGYVLGALAAVAYLLVNLVRVEGMTPEAFIASPWLSVLPAVAIYYYAYSRLFRDRTAQRLTENEALLAAAPSVIGTTLLAVLLWRELPVDVVGFAWLVEALALFLVGMRLPHVALRNQCYGLGALAAVAYFVVNLYRVEGVAPEAFVVSPWLSVTPGVAIYYYAYTRLFRVREAQWLAENEALLAAAPSMIATALLAVLFWRELPSVSVALSWAVLGLVLFEIGTIAAQPALRLQGHVLLGATFVRVFMANFTSTTETFGISHRLLTVGPFTTIVYYVYWRLQELGPVDKASDNREQRLNVLYSYAGAILLVVLARFEFGRAYTVIAWAPLMLGLLVLGVLLNERHFRFQSYILAIMVFARSWATNLYLTGSLLGIPERYATMAPMVVIFLVAAVFCIRKHASYVDQVPVEWARTRTRKVLRSADIHSRTLFALLGPLLAAILLFYEVSGNVLTMAWSIEGFLVLALGFLVMDRSFRLFGLALLAVCVIKLVVIDLEGVETIYRILSYIVLGLLLLLASFAYTRYRDTIRRFL